LPAVWSAAPVRSPVSTTPLNGCTPEVDVVYNIVLDNGAISKKLFDTVGFLWITSTFIDVNEMEGKDGMGKVCSRLRNKGRL